MDAISVIKKYYQHIVSEVTGESDNFINVHLVDSIVEYKPLKNLILEAESLQILKKIVFFDTLRPVLAIILKYDICFIINFSYSDCIEKDSYKFIDTDVYTAHFEFNEIKHLYNLPNVLSFIHKYKLKYESTANDYIKFYNKVLSFMTMDEFYEFINLINMFADKYDNMDFQFEGYVKLNFCHNGVRYYYNDCNECYEEINIKRVLQDLNALYSIAGNDTLQTVDDSNVNNIFDFDGSAVRDFYPNQEYKDLLSIWNKNYMGLNQLSFYANSDCIFAAQNNVGMLYVSFDLVNYKYHQFIEMVKQVKAKINNFDMLQKLLM